QGTLSVINGDIGTTGASTLMTGFHDPGPGCIYTETPLNVGTVNGLIFTAAPPPTVACPTEGTAATMAVATQAATDALAAFNATSPALMPPTVAAQAAELGGLTLPPGVYQSASGTFSIANGDLTLDGQGNQNAVFVFQSATSLTVGIAGPAGARNVILINGAQAKNVYWHVGSAATINGAGGGTMVGTILSQSGITFSTAGNVVLTVLNGRAITLTGPVTMVDTVITVPQP
ncbi:MAG TPA: ice-binding family protein, partial [Terriglobales bacterium]|nr:ice-binding family protein [Terriglobales bacterium]